MEGIGSEELKKFIPEEKCLAILMIDGIAIDERLSVDTSIVPMSFMGLCRHCVDPSFNTMADTVRIKAGLNNKAFHLAKRRTAFALGSTTGDQTHSFRLLFLPRARRMSSMLKKPLIQPTFC